MDVDIHEIRLSLAVAVESKSEYGITVFHEP